MMDSAEKYERLVDLYRDLGNSEELLDRNIERLMEKGVTREEAISTLYKNHEKEIQKLQEKHQQLTEQISMPARQNSRRRSLVTLGVTVTMLGIILSILPFVSSVGWNVWFNESFVVPEASYYYITTSTPFSYETIFHITFNVIEGGDRSLDFLVMDEQNFQKFEAHEPYEYYIESSRKSASRVDLNWIVPAERIYFVFDNSDNFNSRLVSAYFTYRPPVPVPLGLGVIILFAGLGTASYGNRPPTPSSSHKTIIIGYVLAAAGGILGLLLGLGLAISKNSENKYHGKMILAIGAIATITYAITFLPIP